MNTVPSSEPGVAAHAAPGRMAAARNALLVGLVMLLPLLVFHETAWSVVQIWERSETFAHGFLILPISLWLVWRQRAALQQLALQPCWPALLLLAGCGAAWLLADLAEVGIVRQYALAAMLPLTVLAVLGKRIAGALLFPLAFILFAVPVGESLVPPLIDLTANFTVDALRLTGIPVLRDGNNFSIPSGNWSVVDACSGLRYLISSITLGCLFAYLSYRTAWRRAAFVLASILVPIAANGVRAYMIVMMGHLSGMTLAVGVDHLIYGWVFFGIVMLLLFWVGSFWREDGQADAAAQAQAQLALPLPLRPLIGGAAAVLAVLAIWPALAARADQATPAAAPATLALASPTPAGQEFTGWQPDYAPASTTLRQAFAGQPPVGLTVLFYRDAPGSAKLISSTNRIGQQRAAYRENSADLRDENFGGRHMAVREAMLGFEGRRLLVWQWYWVNGSMTSSNYVGKLLQIKGKLLSGNGDGAAVMVFAPYDEDPAVARAAMRGFLDSNLAPLDQALAGTRRP
ncbi:MAG TPA: exosortase A [Pseudoduganella sp.]